MDDQTEQTEEQAAEAESTPPKETKRPKHRHVIEAIAAVTAEMPPVGKDQQMTDGPARYAYRGIEDVTSAAQRLMGKHCVVPSPRVVERNVRVVGTTKAGNEITEEHHVIIYRLYGPGGLDDYIEQGPFHALARDNSDKGTNKALTQAFKQMLVQTFVIGDSAQDPDTYSAESTAAVPARPPTRDELAQEIGWRDAADEENNRKMVVDQLRAKADAGEFSAERGKELWSEYQRPSGPDNPTRTRTRAEHLEWWNEHMVTFKPEDSPLDPLPPQAAESPQEPEAPQPPPEPAAAPETATEPPEPAPDLLGALEDSLAAAGRLPAHPGMAPKGPEAIPDDNGYRDEWDALAARPDEMLAAITETPAPDVIQVIIAHGGTSRIRKAPEHRAHLADILLRNYRTDRQAAGAKAAEELEAEDAKMRALDQARAKMGPPTAG